MQMQFIKRVNIINCDMLIYCDFIVLKEVMQVRKREFIIKIFTEDIVM